MIQNLTFARSYLFFQMAWVQLIRPLEVPHQETLFKAPRRCSGRRPVDWPNISVMREMRQEEEHGSNRRSWRLDFSFLFWFWFSKRSRLFFVLIVRSVFLSWLSRLGCRFVGDELWFSTSEPPKAEWHVSWRDRIVPLTWFARSLVRKLSTMFHN